MKSRRGTPPFVAVALLALPLRPRTRHADRRLDLQRRARAGAKMPSFAWTSGGDLLLLDETKPAATADDRAGDRRRRAARARPSIAAAALASLKALGAAAGAGVAALARRARPGGPRPSTLRRRSLALDLAASRFERLTRADAKSTPRLSPDGRASPSCAATTSGSSTSRRSGDPPHLRRQRDDPERHAFLGLLGGGLRPRRHGLLVVARFASAIAFLRTDDPAVDVTTFTDFAPAVPRVILQRYPRTGRAEPVVRLGIVDARGGADAWMDRGPCLRVHRRRHLAARLQLRRGSDDEPPQTRLDVWRFDRADGERRNSS